MLVRYHRQRLDAVHFTYLGRNAIYRYVSEPMGCATAIGALLALLLAPFYLVLIPVFLLVALVAALFSAGGEETLIPFFKDELEAATLTRKWRFFGPRFVLTRHIESGDLEMCLILSVLTLLGEFENVPYQLDPDAL